MIGYQDPLSDFELLALLVMIHGITLGLNGSPLLFPSFMYINIFISPPLVSSLSDFNIILRHLTTISSNHTLLLTLYSCTIPVSLAP